MRILITGGAGFIGSHLSDAYIARGDSVSVLDDLSTGSICNPYEEAYEEGFEDMIRRVPNTSKIRQLIGFEPRTSLDEIIRRVVAYQKSRHTNETARDGETHVIP